MPFARPSLSDLVRRTAADVETELPGLAPRLRRSLIGTLSRALAGALHALYGYLAWIVRQLFSDTADEAELLRRAAPYGIVPIAAVAATGDLALTGTDGAQVPEGTVWRRGTRSSTGRPRPR